MKPNKKQQTWAKTSKLREAGCPAYTNRVVRQNGSKKTVKAKGYQNIV
jgi:hypothetical protein